MRLNRDRSLRETIEKFGQAYLQRWQPARQWQECVIVGLQSDLHDENRTQILESIPETYVLLQNAVE